MGGVGLAAWALPSASSDPRIASANPRTSPHMKRACAAAAPETSRRSANGTRNADAGSSLLRRRLRRRKSGQYAFGRHLKQLDLVGYSAEREEAESTKANPERDRRPERGARVAGDDDLPAVRGSA